MPAEVVEGGDGLARGVQPRLDAHVLFVAEWAKEGGVAVRTHKSTQSIRTFPDEIKFVCVCVFFLLLFFHGPQRRIGGPRETRGYGGGYATYKYWDT